MLFPKEHGAYGQLIVPTVTALTAAGMSVGALLVSTAAAAGFLMHEPAAVLLGSRGTRARRQQGREAAVWLAACAALGAAALAGALATMPPMVKPWLLAPAIPAAAVAWLTSRRREKTWYGELVASSSLSLVAVPVAMASGATVQSALNIAVPFLALFAVTTLAVRAIIARVRGGGDVKVASAAQRGALGATVIVAVVIAAAAAIGLVDTLSMVATVPGLVTAAILSLRPPPPAKLRVVGWTLVGTSLATAVIVIAAH